MAKKAIIFKNPASETLEKFRRMATVIKDSNDAITFQDLDGNILAWNQGAEKMYGYSETEALRMNIVDTVPLEYQEQARQFLYSLKRGELVPNLETKRRHKNGRIIDVWLTNTKLTDEKGALTGIATTERDISQSNYFTASSQYARSLIEASLDPLVTISLEGKITDVNNATIEITGLSRKALIGSDFPNYFSEPDKARDGYRQVFAKGSVTDYPLTLQGKDGKRTDVLYNASIYKDLKGNVLGVVSTARDVTAQRQLEYLWQGQIAFSEKMRGEQTIAQLGQNVLSFLVPFTNGQVGAFYALVADNRLQQVSSYALAKSEASQKPILFGEGLVGQVALEKKTLLIENVPPGYFYKVESALGEMIPRSLLVFPILYENEVKGVIELGSLHSFTEQQRAFLSHVSQSIGIALNTSEVQKKVQVLLEQSQATNSQMQTQQEALRVANEELEDQSDTLKNFQTQLQNEQTKLEETNSQLEENTQALKQQKNVLNEKNAELNKAQILLEEKASEVQRASQYKTEFLANMSHELRTPLNSSLILAKLLMENSQGNLTTEQIQFAGSIYSSGHDLLDLINDVLDLSKVEAGKLDINVESVFIPKLVDEIKKNFHHMADEKKLAFEIEVETDIPQSFTTDRQRLHQILKNLVSNAFKFTTHGSVKIRLYRHSKGTIAFDVIDSGIGITKDQQEIIFEAFRQADGTINRKYGGTGLGLSISRDLAKVLGGRIEVKSTAGYGSSFTLILPEAYQDLPKVTAPAKFYSDLAVDEKKENAISARRETALALPFTDDRDDLGKSGRTILVIEDEPQFSKILLDLARELKFKCLVSQGADEGFDMATFYIPDAILLDIKLPDHLGLTVLDRLKENLKTRHIPVHVISVEDYLDAALQMGAIGYLQKPANRDDIKKVFEKLEARFSQKISHVLIVQGDDFQRNAIRKMIEEEGIEFAMVASAKEALIELKKTVFDCMIIDIDLPDMSGDKLLEEMGKVDISFFPPVIVYIGNPLTKEQEDGLRIHSKSLLVKTAKSPERLLDEVTLFLHRVEAKMPPERRQALKTAKSREQFLEGKKILVVDDDIRNIFALTSALEQKGATVIVGRNGQEALDQLEQNPETDLVVMDIMMPVMDGYEAIGRIRQQANFSMLPIIAVTARAMKDDQKKCLKAGFNDYLSKPVDLDKLFSLIRVWAYKYGRV